MDSSQSQLIFEKFQTFLDEQIQKILNLNELPVTQAILDQIYEQLSVDDVDGKNTFLEKLKIILNNMDKIKEISNQFLNDND